MKAPVFLVIHMYPTVKAHGSVGRHAKPVVRPRKFATHKRHMILQKKWSLEYDIQKVLVYKQNEILFENDHWMRSSMTVLSRMDIVVCGKSR